MTHTDSGAPCSTHQTEQRTRKPVLGSLRQARIQRVFEGVVASYIHEISGRNGSGRLREAL
jgi:hypothetical protein